jgi:hypothetical protein
MSVILKALVGLGACQLLSAKAEDMFSLHKLTVNMTAWAYSDQHG